jgi:uncharacterized membrane protein YkgB
VDVLQVIGAVLILAAFVANQRGLLRSSARSYLVLNLVGSLILAWIAWDERDWGFLLLEGVWAIVSAWSLAQLARGREPAGAH